MKKKSIIFTLLLAIFMICIVPSTKTVDALSEDNAYNTKIVGLNHELVNSNLAYEAIHILNPGFNTPTDIFIDEDDMVYVTAKNDTKSVVYRFNSDTQSWLDPIGGDVLKSAEGISVGTDGRMYVCDPSAKKIVVFNTDGTINKEITVSKETSTLYGSNDFAPMKVSVDQADNVYVVSQGNSDGVIRISEDGVFMGYFAPNNVQVTLSLLIRRMLVSKEERDLKFSLKPKASTNLFVDSRNVLYTVIDSEATTSLKKFNIQGTNILSGRPFFSSSYQDITVDKDGFIYTIDKNTDGNISMMDNNGNLLFRFGKTESTSGSTDKLGTFSSASGIAIDSEGNVWALDKVGANIQVFMKTEFARRVIQAKELYNNGEYDQAQIVFDEILRDNSNFVEAYQGLGEIAMRNRDFKEALNYFRIANDKTGYSEAYWELRDAFLGKYLIVFLVLILIFVIWKVFHLSKRLKKIMPEKAVAFKDKVKNSEFVQESSYLKKILTKPTDTYYDLKFRQAIHVRTAVVWFVIFIVIMILSDYAVSGYLFRADTTNFNLGFQILKWVLAIMLFTIANHLISSLQNGEAFYRDVFIGTIFALAPLILFYLPLSILSNALTYNEAFLFKLATILLYAWTIFNILVMLKSIQNYSLGQFIVNLILTFLTMIIMIFLFLIVYILFMQFFDFISGVISEVSLR